jgi:hypothetical protein
MVGCCALRTNGNICNGFVFSSDEPFDICARHFTVGKKRGILLADGTFAKFIDDGKDPCVFCGILIAKSNMSKHCNNICKLKGLKESAPNINIIRIQYAKPNT